jgi:hypothetical protein
MRKEMNPDQNWKTRIFIIGSIVGAMAGVGAAFLLVKRAEEEHTQPRLTAGEGVQLGLGLLGLMRLIASVGGEKEKK